MAEIITSNKTPRIYAYTEPQYKDTAWQGGRYGKGLIKVGYTTKSVQNRIAEQFGTNKPTDTPYEILLDEVAIRKDNTYFTDHEVHKMLEKLGCYRFKNTEWFECTTEEVEQAIFAVKNHKTDISNRINDFGMRPEQKRAVELTSSYFRQYSYDKEHKAPHFLWNAKMRFGKTFTTYQLAKEMGWTKVLVLTFKPAVQNSWEEDLKTHVDFQDWQFISRTGLQYNDINENKPYVWFASFQDVLQKTDAGGIKERNQYIVDIKWDCIVLDEYHFGAWRDSAKDLYDAEDKEQEQEAKQIQKENGQSEIDYYDEELMPLNTSAYLYLSGTPFRALKEGEFMEEQIFNWTYTDEQKAKAEWGVNANNCHPELVSGSYDKKMLNQVQHDNNSAVQNNPYAELPKMVMMTYEMPPEIKQIAVQGEFDAFDLNEFFSASEINGHALFKYEQQVVDWLNLIRGQYKPTTLDELKSGEKPPMPYSNLTLLNNLNHTFWFLPSVASCKAMGELLRNHPFYKEYDVVVCAGNEAGMGVEALKPVREAIKNGFNTKTITLSCGKLTTGVTVPEWSGIFMLRNTASPETYFQSAFRVQSPWTVKNPDGLNPNEKVIVKDTCLVFDFSPNRALKQISDYCENICAKTNEPIEKTVEEILNFLPVLCYDGSIFKPLNANDLLDIVVCGTAQSMLARRWQSFKLVNAQDEVLEKLLNNEQAMQALESIEDFRNLNKEITTIINKSEEIKKVKKENKEKLSTDVKKELTEKEKEMKSKRRMIQEKLLKFATRVPVFMYLTDDREQTLKDVITQLEPALFQKVTGLNIPDFELLVSIGVFNETLMNKSVLAFKRSEDASLEYTGLNTHTGQFVGAWNTKVSIDDYKKIGL